MTQYNKNLPHIEHYGRPAKRNLSKNHLYASGVNDVAQGQWPPVEAPRPLGLRGYSEAVGAVELGHSPKKYDRYA